MENEQIDFDNFDFDDAIVVTPESEEVEINEESTNQDNDIVTTTDDVVTIETAEEAATVIKDDEDKTLKSSEEKKVDFTAWAEFFAEQGVIKGFNKDKFDGSLESLKDLVAESINKDIDENVTEYKNTLEEIRARHEALIEGGVPEEQIIPHLKDLKSLQKISKEALSTDEAVQKQFLKQYFKETTKFNDKQIDKLITQKLEIGDTDDLGELYDEYNEVLLAKEKAMIKASEDAEKEEELQIKNTLESINKHIDDSTEFLGVKLNPQLKAQIKNEYKIIKLPNGQTANPVMLEREKNPVAFDFAVRVCKALGLLNIDEKTKQWTPDLKRFKTNITSSVTKKLADEFGNGKNITPGKHVTDLGGNGTMEEKAKDLLQMLNNL